MRIVLGATAALIAAVLSGAGTANAAVSCSYDGTHAVSVNMTANNDVADLAVAAGNIVVNATQCGTATVDNTSEIVMIGSSGAQIAFIDESGGNFVHSSGTGELEIKFSVKLSTGTDSLTVIGGPGDDAVHIGTLGMNLDGDTDIDVTLGSVERLGVTDFLGGTNTFTANGNFGTGSAWPNGVDLEGSTGDDTLSGGNGVDNITGNGGNDTMDGGASQDFLTGGDGNDVIDGGDDNDQIDGGADDDTLSGGPGSDTFSADPFPDGDDSIAGGDDVDSMSYSIRGSAGIAMNLDGVANDGRAGMETDNVMADVENLTGSQGPDTIDASAAQNIIDGQGGDDTLSGGASADLIFGGNFDSGVDTISGGDGDDTISGGDGADQVNGDNGADSVVGDQGNDTERGGRGNDSFQQVGTTAGDGSDVLIGGDGSDQVSYFPRQSGLTVTLDNNANDGLANEHDNVKADVEKVFGGAGDDTITGSAADNQLNGFNGNDTIDGGDGLDFLSGDIGDDTITGGDGADTMSGGSGADRFHALDGGTDFVSGGTDADTDTVLDSDPFDTLSQIP
jgi:Ca2+-binding RTX toxin-like protein